MTFDVKQYKHEWYLRNKEKTIERTAARRLRVPETRKEEYQRSKERQLAGIGVAEMRRLAREKAVSFRRINPRIALFRSCKGSAKRRGLDFSITIDDIQIPLTCPVLGIPLIHGSGRMKENSASIDRLDSTKGYVPGNVWIISWRANRIKSDSNINELRSLVSAIEKKMLEESQ
jgi:hypothetical protein